MAPASALKVTLTRLTGEDALDERNLSLSLGSYVQVGRASKTEHKRLVPAVDNCWIKNPVISRNHAVISYKMDKTDKPTVYLRDDGSSHDTFVNKTRIKGKGLHAVGHGDIIQFGDNVDKAGEVFHPPAYLLGIAQPRTPEQAVGNTTGRTIMCPEDFSDDSGAEDESESEAGSDDSHSSPPAYEDKTRPSSSLPGSYGNPLNVDDETTSTRVVINLEDSREPSEEYEPSLRIAEPRVVRDAFSQEAEEEIYEPNNYFDDETESQEDYDGYAESEVGEPSEAPSPVYAPTSPNWPTLRTSFLPPPPSILPQPVPQMSHNANPSVYWDGPFAQPEQSFTQGEPFEFYGEIRDLNPPNTWSSQTAPPKPMPEAQNPSVTVNTQNFLGSMPAPKNDMSIHSLINPPVAAAPSDSGTKRKADEIEEVPQLPNQREFLKNMDFQLSTPEPVEAIATVSTEEEENVAMVEQEVAAVAPEVLVEEAPVAVSTEERPSKRMRTATALATGFIFGAMGTLAGLMALPDGIFA